MTWQDIYPVVQMVLQLVIGGGIIVAVCRYFRVLRQSIESQEKTIAAQAEFMKAQSTVLQDFECLSKLMQQVIDAVSDPAALQREQAYKARVDRDAAETLQQSIAKALEQHNKDCIPLTFGSAKLISEMMPYLDLKQRQALIKASGLPSPVQELFLKDERTRPDVPATNEHPLA
jgi:hypothetical protein